MNCKELQEDIKKLKSLQQEMRDKYDEVIESEHGKALLNDTSKQVFETSDQILEKYLKDFEANYLNVFLSFGERIEGFNDTVSAIAKISDGQFMVGGYDGEVRVLTQSPDGEWKFGEDIEGFNYHVFAITKISDGQFIVGGDCGKVKVLTQSLDGEWKFGKEIEGFNYHVFAITKISDGQFIMGGMFGEIRVLTQSPDDGWKLSEKIEEFNDHVRVIAKISDGQFIVGGDDGEVRVLSVGLTLERLKQAITEGKIANY